jgi:cytochrome c1
MKKIILSILTISSLIIGCGGEKTKQDSPDSSTEVKTKEKSIDPMSDKGVGPITSVTIGDIDEALVAKGHEIFKAKCTACHRIGKRFIGPDLTGVTKKQSPEWIMNMILNPEIMVVENAKAKELLMEYSAPMANQNLTEEEARAVYEYFRTKN